MASKNLYVGNLPFTTTQAELEQLFGQYGTVTKAQVITDRETGTQPGSEMSAGDEAAGDERRRHQPGHLNSLPRESARGGGGGGGWWRWYAAVGVRRWAWRRRWAATATKLAQRLTRLTPGRPGESRSPFVGHDEHRHFEAARPRG